MGVLVAHGVSLAWLVSLWVGNWVLAPWRARGGILHGNYSYLLWRAGHVLAWRPRSAARRQAQRRIRPAWTSVTLWVKHHAANARATRSRSPVHGLGYCRVDDQLGGGSGLFVGRGVGLGVPVGEGARGRLVQRVLVAGVRVVLALIRATVAVG